MTEKAKLSRSEIARLGGKALVEKRGIEHMKKIGKKGGETTHNLYNMKPWGTNGWCYVNKSGVIIAKWE